MQGGRLAVRAIAQALRVRARQAILRALLLHRDARVGCRAPSGERGSGITGRIRFGACLGAVGGRYAHRPGSHPPDRVLKQTGTGWQHLSAIEVHISSLVHVEVPQVTPEPELAPALEPLPAFPDPLALPDVGPPEEEAPEELLAPDVAKDPLEAPLIGPVIDPVPEPLDDPLAEPALDPLPLPPPSRACSPRVTALPPQPIAAPPVTRQSIALPIHGQA